MELVTALVDWISITVLMHDGDLLLKLLSEMLSFSDDVTVQLAAVECLLAVTGSRKVLPPNCATALLVFINEEFISICMFWMFVDDLKSYELISQRFSDCWDKAELMTVLHSGVSG